MWRPDKMHVVTNHQPRLKIDWYDLTEAEKQWLDYVKTDDQGSWEGFRYRGSVYDLGEFELAPDHIKALGFDGIQGTSYFDCIAVQFFDKDGEYRYDEVVVAHIHW